MRSSRLSLSGLGLTTPLSCICFYFYKRRLSTVQSVSSQTSAVQFVWMRAETEPDPERVSWREGMWEMFLLASHSLIANNPILIFSRINDLYPSLSLPIAFEQIFGFLRRWYRTVLQCSEQWTIRKIIRMFLQLLNTNISEFCFTGELWVGGPKTSCSSYFLEYMNIVKLLHYY